MKIALFAPKSIRLALEERGFVIEENHMAADGLVFVASRPETVEKVLRATKYERPAVYFMLNDFSLGLAARAAGIPAGMILAGDYSLDRAAGEIRTRLAAGVLPKKPEPDRPAGRAEFSRPPKPLWVVGGLVRGAGASTLAAALAAHFAVRGLDVVLYGERPEELRRLLGDVEAPVLPYAMPREAGLSIAEADVSTGVPAWVADADAVLLVLTPTEKAYEAYERFSERHPDLAARAYYALNLVDASKPLRYAYVDMFAGRLPRLPVVIPDDDAVHRAYASGKPPIAFEPYSVAAAEIERLIGLPAGVIA